MRKKIFLVILLFIFYIITFFIFIPFFGDKSTALALIPLICTAMLFGGRTGIVAAIFFFLVNSLLLIINGYSIGSSFISHMPGAVASIFLAGAAGFVGSLQRKSKRHLELLEQEKNERKRAEEKIFEMQKILQYNSAKVLPGKQQNYNNGFSFSGKLYRDIAENAVDIIYIVNPEGYFTYMNKMGLTNTGYSEEEVLKLRYYDVILPEYINSVKNFYLRQYVRKEDNSYLEFPFYLKDGSCKWYGQNACMNFEEGVFTGFTVIARDISARKEAELKLRHSEKEYKRLFMIVHEPIMVFEPENEIVLEVNNAACKVYGYSREEFIGMSLKDITFNIPAGREKINQTLSAGELLNNHTIHYNKDGKKLFFEINASVIEYKGEKAILTINRDITDKLEQEEKIKLMFTAIENSSEIVSLTNPENKFIFVNKAFLDAYGYKESEIIGKTPDIIGSPSNPLEIQSEIYSATNKGRWSGTLCNMRKDGSEFMISLNTSPVLDNDGNVFALLGIARDITDELEAEKEREMQREIKESLEREKQVSELKSRFISVASHEFRTPLTTILASADLLEIMGPKWEDQKFRGHIAKIQNSVSYMTELIDDVLIINRAETGRITLTPERLNLLELVNEAIENARPASTEEHCFQLKYEIPEEFFKVDRKLLNQILSNLLSNAIKYSPKGGEIILWASLEGCKLVLRISDNGIGIPEEDLEHLFEPFHRGKNTGNIIGTGLGLSIVKKAVDIHSGEIYVDSLLGKGTTFSIQLPVLPLSENTDPAAPFPINN